MCKKNYVRDPNNYFLQKVTQINLLYLVITLKQVFYEHKPMIHKSCMNTTIVVIFS